MSTEPNQDSTAPSPATAAPSSTTAPASRRSASSIVLLVVGVVVAAALVVFIVQNLSSSRVEFLGLAWNLPLGLNMLLAALAGALVTALVASVRIIGLRRALRRRR